VSSTLTHATIQTTSLDRSQAVTHATTQQTDGITECVPRANAICGRVIGTIRRECLDRMLILGRRHLEAVLAEYVEHYNTHRPHRSLDQRAPSPHDSPLVPIGDVDLAKLRRTDRLGGLIHDYRIAA